MTTATESPAPTAITIDAPTVHAIDELDTSSDYAWMTYFLARDEMLGRDGCETLRFTDRRRGWLAGEIQTCAA